MSEQSPSSPRPKRKRTNDHDSNSDSDSDDKKDTSGKREKVDPNATINNAPTAGEDEKWSQELHRLFVAAIHDAGLSQSSPSVLMENMTSRPESLTSERVKSHLQKYRKNKEKSRAEFLGDYDSFMRKAMTVGSAGNHLNHINGRGNGSASHVIMPPEAMMEMMGGGKAGGDIAGFLSYSVMTEGETKNGASGAHSMSPLGIQRQSQDYLKTFAGARLQFPQLTEEEKHSPLGVSMVYVMGLFSSLSQQMMKSRRQRQIRNTTSAMSYESQLPASASYSMPPPANVAVHRMNSILQPHSPQQARTNNNNTPNFREHLQVHHHQMQEQYQQQQNQLFGGSVAGNTQLPEGRNWGGATDAPNGPNSSRYLL